MMIMKMHRSIQ